MAIVGVIMGSTSDYEVMQDACKILDEFNIDYEKKVVSAHRTPKLMYDYATTAKDRGIKIIIAGAGGAAHLPGMVSALTPLPVIGVPVKSRALSGVDSLLSIVQMPGGIPTLTVAINQAKNAALSAIAILALSDETLAKKYDEYRKNQTEQVLNTTL